MSVITPPHPFNSFLKAVVFNTDWQPEYLNFLWVSKSKEGHKDKSLPVKPAVASVFLHLLSASALKAH